VNVRGRVIGAAFALALEAGMAKDFRSRMIPEVGADMSGSCGIARSDL